MRDVLVVTTDEAAAIAGVRPGTIRLWVMRGRLTPLRRGAKPLRFIAADVWTAVDQARSEQQRDRLDTLASAWRTAVLDTSGHQV